VLIPLWLQSVIGYSASESGHVMAFIGVFAVLVAPLASKVMEKVDLRMCITGGMLWLVMTTLLRTQWSTDGSFWDFSLPQLLQGFGMPFFFIGLMTFALSAIPPKETASAAGLLSFMRTISGAIGTALSTAFWDDASRQSRDQMVGTLGENANAAAAKLQAAGYTEPQARAMIERLVDAQSATVGASHVFWMAATVLFIAAWLPWLAKRPKVLFSGAAPAH
ncbi:MFS transporter, partial [Novosphingobium sp.]|uniref:MFS transporter n=1 Tax=Novosphingobium sp. TaxID=1874826 RepID=UPI0035B2A440